MKFKNAEDDAGKYRLLLVNDTDGDVLMVESAKKRVYISAPNDASGVEMTRAKALKLAWAIINELDPI